MADENMNYNNVDTAEGRYNKLMETREHYLDRGRQCSELTIPTLIPENSTTPSQDFYSPFQSVGSRGVNNLASKLLLLLLPPNQPFFRLAVEGKAKQQVDANPQLKTAIEKSSAGRSFHVVLATFPIPPIYALSVPLAGLSVQRIED